VDLLGAGQANFCLIANPGSSFDTGTAGMLNQFLEQYDEEDGVWGNLTQAPIGATAPEGFAGWRIIIASDAEVEPSRARLDLPNRAIHVEGRSPGEARRAMVVFLRLLDRKYPHVGRLFPLKYYPKHPLELMTEQTRQFFTDFPDQQFLVKPILRREHEELYANDNMDFAGKYDLRWSPYIFEPTYGDDYVYGFEG